MLKFPYDDSSLTFQPRKPITELTAEDDWVAYFIEWEYLHCNAMLEAIAADVAAIPNAIGMCVVTGSAHGYDFQNAVVQLADRRFLALSRSDREDQSVVFTPLTLALDLPSELHHLRTDGTILRGRGNHNYDHKQGYEGRISTIYLVVGTEAEWVESPRPLLGGEHTNNAINRIFRAMLSMENEMTLI